MELSSRLFTDGMRSQRTESKIESRKKGGGLSKRNKNRNPFQVFLNFSETKAEKEFLLWDWVRPPTKKIKSVFVVHPEKL